MDMAIVDVLIIGAGPAGTMTAYMLAQAGLKVLILEKAAFPRQKTCGGGLTQRAYQEIPFNIDPIIHKSVTWGYVGVNCRNYAPIQGNRPIAYLINRPAFDAFLLQQALHQGAMCHFGQRCLSLNQKDDIITIYTDDQKYQGHYLIGADGIHSRVARELGLLPNRLTSLAHEARLIPNAKGQNSRIDSITFDFGLLASGYAWIFPKRDHLNVGVFRSWPGKRTSKKHLEKFIAQHPVLSQASLEEIRAFPVPLGIRREKLHNKQALLVGDAANLADPWLGEGLYYALCSGKIAAEEILRHERGETLDLAGYSRKIHQGFSEQFACAKRLSVLINASPNLSLWLLKSSATLQGMIIDLLRGEKSHVAIWREIQTWLPKKIIGKAKNLFP